MSKGTRSLEEAKAKMTEAVETLRDLKNSEFEWKDLMSDLSLTRRDFDYAFGFLDNVLSFNLLEKYNSEGEEMIG